MEQFEDRNALLPLTVLSNPNTGQGFLMKFNVQTESYYECKKKKKHMLKTYFEKEKTKYPINNYYIDYVLK